ncbi:glycosyltransferase [Patescibacteria group bacterium]|nr:glycosyltransferase [Patescibacteria group bacterium]
MVIITLNEEKTLPRLLKQLADQTVQNFELIISDSNSSDRTEQVAKEYSSVGTEFHFYNCGVTKGPGY